MPLITKTFDDLHAMALGAIRSGLPSANLSPGTDYDIAARMAAVMALLGQSNAEWLARQLFPKGADADMVEEHAALRGMSRRAATKMVGRVMLTATSGTSTQNSGSALSAGDGRTYKTTANATVALPSFTGKTVAAGSTARRLFVLPDVSSMAAGDLVSVNSEVMAIRDVLTAINAIDLYQPLSSVPSAATAINAQRGVTAPIEADEAGAAGNQIEGDWLTLSSPATGVDTLAKLLVSGGGADEETTGELAARLQLVLAVPGGAGSATQIRSFLRAYEAQRVEEAIVVPGLRGIGTVDVFVIGPSGGRVLPLTDGVMLAALKATLPEQIDVSLRSVEYDTETSVDLTFLGAPGFEADWGPGAGIAGQLALTGSSHTTTRIFVTTNPALQGCVTGKRIVLPVKYGTRWVTEQRVVGSTGFATNWFVDVTSPLPAPPVTADVPTLYSGGPAVDGVIAAVTGVFDAQGPCSFSSTAQWQRVPSDAEAFPSRLFPSAIVAAVLGTEGVAGATLTAPAALVTPATGKVARLGKFTIAH